MICLSLAGDPTRSEVVLFGIFLIDRFTTERKKLTSVLCNLLTVAQMSIKNESSDSNIQQFCKSISLASRSYCWWGQRKRWQDGCVAIAHAVDSLRQYSYRVIKPEPLFFKRDDIRTTLFRVSLQHQRMMLQAHDAFQRPMFHEVLRLAIACRRSLRRSSLNKPRRPSSRVFISFFYPLRSIIN